MSQIYQDEKLSLIFQVQHRGMIQTKIYIKMLLGQALLLLYILCISLQESTQRSCCFPGRQDAVTKPA